MANTRDEESAGRPHLAGMVDDQFNAALVSLLRRRGWRHRVLTYTGYGSPDFVRVLARVVLASRDGVRYDPEDAQLKRGWRNFATAEVPHAAVTVEIDGSAYEVSADRNGTLDTYIEHHGLEPGWHEVVLRTEQSDVVRAPILIVDPECTAGIVSDLDDTVISTFLPRPLIAAYNTFWAPEQARRPVRGMAEFYAALIAEQPCAPTFYVSTGAWNTAGSLRRFLRRHAFPAGPMLLTDWGPTNTGWFRSGQEHKRRCLEGLVRDFPQIAWLLVGDNGQHDPHLYGEFAKRFPEKVRAIAIRELGMGEQLLTTSPGMTNRGLMSLFGQEARPSDPYVVSAPDGHGLLEALSEDTDSPQM